MSDVLNVKGYENFKRFILGTRERWGEESRGFYVLSAKERTDITTLRYNTSEGILRLVFRKKDAYFIAWKTPKGELYIFDNEVEVFKHFKAVNGGGGGKDGEITPIDLADAEPVGMSNSYPRLCTKFGLKRNKVALGQNCIVGALKSLSEMKKMGGHAFLKRIAESSIVIMQMIPECARFESMLTYVKEVFKNDRPPLEELVKLQNQWDTLSQEIHQTATPDLTDKHRNLKLIMAANTRQQKANPRERING